MRALTFARVLLAQPAALKVEDALADATRLLDRLLIAAETGQRTGSMIEILTLQVLAHQATGDDAEARTALERALALAEPEEYVRVFLDEGAALVGLLRSAARRARHENLARRVFAALTSAPVYVPVRNGSDVSDGLTEPLSDRELDVLRLLRSQLSGPDIARELRVSVDTLRTHTKHIYTKLGASSRRAAIARAEEFGLLQSAGAPPENHHMW